MYLQNQKKDYVIEHKFLRTCRENLSCVCLEYQGRLREFCDERNGQIEMFLKLNISEYHRIFQNIVISEIDKALVSASDAETNTETAMLSK